MILNLKKKKVIDPGEKVEHLAGINKFNLMFVDNKIEI
jgi:hypothetical protein